MNELCRPLVVADPYPLTGSAGAARLLERQHAHRLIGKRVAKVLLVGIDECSIRVNGCRLDLMWSRVFECLWAKYPVIANSLEGSAPRRLFAESRDGISVLPHGPMAKSLAAFVMVARSGSASPAGRSALERRESACLEMKLAAILDRLTAGFPRRRTST